MKLSFKIAPPLKKRHESILTIIYHSNLQNKFTLSEILQGMIVYVKSTTK